MTSAMATTSQRQDAHKTNTRAASLYIRVFIPTYHTQRTRYVEHAGTGTDNTAQPAAVTRFLFIGACPALFFGVAFSNALFRIHTRTRMICTSSSCCRKVPSVQSTRHTWYTDAVRVNRYTCIIRHRHNLKSRTFLPRTRNFGVTDIYSSYMQNPCTHL